MKSEQEVRERWRLAAEAYGFQLPAEQVERIAPTLEALLERSRAALERDLSQTDPVFSFRPARPEKAS